MRKLKIIKEKEKEKEMSNQWKVALKRFVLGCGVKVGLAVVISSAGGLLIKEDDTKAKIVGMGLLTFGAYMAAAFVTDDIMEKLYPFE